MLMFILECLEIFLPINLFDPVGSWWCLLLMLAAIFFWTVCMLFI